MHTMAKFLMEICLTDYSMLEYLPSQIAAAALYISNKLYSDGQWVKITPTKYALPLFTLSLTEPCTKTLQHVF